jgi:hypothetical protein
MKPKKLIYASIIVLVCISTIMGIWLSKPVTFDNFQEYDDYVNEISYGNDIFQSIDYYDDYTNAEIIKRRISHPFDEGISLQLLLEYDTDVFNTVKSKIIADYKLIEDKEYISIREKYYESRVEYQGYDIYKISFDEMSAFNVALVGFNAEEGKISIMIYSNEYLDFYHLDSTYDAVKEYFFLELE